MRLVSILLLISTFSVSGQETPSYSGTEFWFGTSKSYFDSQFYDIKVLIYSEYGSSGTVSIPEQDWSEDFDLEANQIQEIDLPDDLALSEVANGLTHRAIHIESDAPIQVTHLNRKLHFGDITRILPVQSLGSSYAAIGNNSDLGNSFLNITAIEDSTEIEIIQSIPLVLGAFPGDTLDILLNRGQSYQIEVLYETDLSGITIQASSDSESCKPFNVLSGNYRSNVPDTCLALDYLMENLLPVSFFESEYFVAPLIEGLSCSYRAIALYDNTQINRNNSETINLNKGEFWEWNHVEYGQHFLSNEDFCLVRYIEGNECTPAGDGDPSMSIVFPLLEQEQNIGFAAVPTEVVSNFYINIVCHTSSIGQLELNGESLSTDTFQAYAFNNELSYANISLEQGAHLLHSPEPISATLYGIGFSETYSTPLASQIKYKPEIVQRLCGPGDLVLSAEDWLDDVQWYYQDFPTDILSSSLNLELAEPYLRGTYYAEGTDLLSGCLKTLAFLVGASVVESPDLLSAPNAYCSQDSVVVSFTESQGIEYSWLNSEYASINNDQNPFTFPAAQGYVYLKSEDIAGCGSRIDSLFFDPIAPSFYSLNINPTNDSICSGEELELHAELKQAVYQESFSELTSGFVQSIEGGMISAACGSLNGNAIWFNGTGVRSIQTIPVLMVSGDIFSFYLKIGSEGFPCANVDENQGLLVQYSENGSLGPWITLEEINGNAYSEFENVQLTIPENLAGEEVSFRIVQPDHDGLNTDNWTVDEIALLREDITLPSYSWYPDDYLNENTDATVSATPDSSHYFYVDLDLEGCTYTDSIFIWVEQPFEIDAGDDQDLCLSLGLQLSASSNSNNDLLWNWSPGEVLSDSTVSNPEIEIDVDTLFVVEATGLGGCTDTDSINIQLSIPALDLGTNLSICPGDSTIIDSDIDDDFIHEWNTESTETSIYASQPGIYSLTISNGNGCEKEDSVQVGWYTLPEIDLNELISACEGDTIILEAGEENDGNSYFWNTGSEEHFLEVVSSGLYVVSVITPESCQVADSSSVVFEPSPENPFDTQYPLCEGDTITLDAENQGSSYLWSTGNENQEIDVWFGGQYSVLIELGSCQETFSTNVEEFDFPEVELISDTTLCLNEGPILLQVSDQVDSLRWSTGQQSPSINVPSSGVYWVDVYNSICISSDTVEINFLQSPEVAIANRYLECLDDCESPFFLNTAFEEGEGTWNGNPLGDSLVVYNEGWYELEFIHQNGCSRTYNTYIENDCEASVIYIPTAFSPNRDGINENFEVVPTTELSNFEIRIYNRWGQEVFKSNDPNFTWNGGDYLTVYRGKTEIYSYNLKFKYLPSCQSSEFIEKKIDGVLTAIR